MTSKQQQARELYLTQNLSQREIAQQVGVSERTVYTWVHQYAWNKLRVAALSAPITMVDNFSSALVELQNAIAARKPGERYPTPKEAEVSRKLVANITSLKKSNSLAQNMQMMTAFRDFVRPYSRQFSEQLAYYADKFFETRSRQGYTPYDMEYGVEKIAAVAPFYEELNGDEPCDHNISPVHAHICTTRQECPDRDHCNYPKCSITKIEDKKDKYPIEEPWPLAPSPMAIPSMPRPETETPADSIAHVGADLCVCPAPHGQSHYSDIFQTEPEVAEQSFDDESVMSFLFAETPVAAGSNPATPQAKNSSENTQPDSQTSAETIPINAAPLTTGNTPAETSAETTPRIFLAHPEAGVQIIEDESINDSGLPQTTVAAGSYPATHSDGNIPENFPQNGPDKTSGPPAADIPNDQPQPTPPHFPTPDQMFNRRHYVRPRKMGPLPDN